MLEKQKFGGWHVAIHTSLLDELCDESNEGILVDMFYDIKRIIAAPRKNSQSRIDLYSIDDVYRHLNPSEPIKLPLKPSPEKLLGSKEFLGRLEIAAKEYLNLKGDLPMIKQSELVSLYRSAENNRVTQSGLSNMINRNWEAHKITILNEPDSYSTLLEKVNPFKKLNVDNGNSDNSISV